MALKKGDVISIEITDMAFGGKGFTKIDGLAVFVENAVAGDIVEAKIYKKKNKYAEAYVEKIITPSPNRVQPKCLHAGICGGCKWQHLSYEKQLFYKTQQVKDVLTHIGLLSDITVFPILASKKIFEYRNKMEFSCSNRRWLTREEMLQSNPPNRDFAIGLHAPGTFDRILDTQICYLQPSFGNILLEKIREFIHNSNFPLYNLRTHEGFWRFIMLRHAIGTDKWLVNLVTSKENNDILIPFSKSLIEQYPSVRSVVNNVTARKAGIAVGEYEITLAGENTLLEKLGGYIFEISANSFFQTNTHQAKILYDTIKKYANLKGDEVVFDLYTGTGSIAIYLSNQARKIIGFELVESAIQDARKNARRNNVSNCEFISGDVKDTFFQVTEKPDVLILDPPRTGVHQDVIQAILKLAPPKIIYVSCNPATLARDVRILKENYLLKKVQPVDMFPHTFHIECVALLEKL